MITLANLEGRLVGSAKTAAAAGEPLASLRDVLRYATALAQTMRDRHVKQASPTDPVRPYGVKQRLRVSRAYQRAVGLSGDKTIWRNSQAFHAAARIRKGSFAGTRGMWAGLDVRNKGNKEAVIEFRGSSQAQSQNFRKPIKEIAALRRAEIERIDKLKSAKVRAKARERLRRFFARYIVDANTVTNQAKAYAVFKALKAHPLKPTAPENLALQTSFAEELEDAVVLHLIDALQSGGFGQPMVIRRQGLAGSPVLLERLRQR